MGRFDCLGIETDAQPRRFDPRFEEHCGELHEGHTERNYAFVDGLRKKERAELEKRLRRAPKDEEARAALRRVNAQIGRRKAEQRRQDIKEQARAAEKEAVRRGKTPYFLKRSQLREMELEAKFNELKESGGVKKYIEKRRRRKAAKDRKRLPERRNE